MALKTFLHGSVLRILWAFFAFPWIPGQKPLLDPRGHGCERDRAESHPPRRALPRPPLSLSPTALTSKSLSLQTPVQPAVDELTWLAPASFHLGAFEALTQEKISLVQSSGAALINWSGFKSSEPATRQSQVTRRRVEAWGLGILRSGAVLTPRVNSRS